MKIFVSSLISGFEQFREAARSAIVNLRHEPVMAEDFGALPHTPQVACLKELRGSDVVVLILGEHYGTVQGSSNVSPTHEEFLEGRGSKPILMFVQKGVMHEARQKQLIEEAQGWQGGNFRESFATAEELKDKITRALHDYQLSTASAPLDVRALIDAALNLLPRAHSHQSGGPMLQVAFASGPSQRVLRPVELEATEFTEALHARALFGEGRLLDKAKGAQPEIRDGSLIIEQERGALIMLDERGSILIRSPLDKPSGVERSGFGSRIAIIEEDVTRELGNALAFANWTLDRIDSLQRLSHIALAARIDGSDYLGWRTKAEDDASPGSGQIGMGGESKQPIQVDRPRGALRYQARELAEDIMVSMRRQWKSRR